MSFCIGISLELDKGSWRVSLALQCLFKFPDGLVGGTGSVAEDVMWRKYMKIAIMVQGASLLRVIFDRDSKRFPSISLPAYMETLLSNVIELGAVCLSPRDDNLQIGLQGGQLLPAWSDSEIRKKLQ